MTLNRAKLGRVVTFSKYLPRVVSLIFLLKTLIWNKITFLASIAELLENEPMTCISKKITNIPFSILLLVIVKILRSYD